METENTTTAVADPPQSTSASASTDTTTAELEKHSSFLGYRPGIVATAEQPETSAETTTTEQVETQPDTEATTTDETEDPNWLPDEQQKVFPDDVIAKYGKRYGYTLEQIQANPSLRQLLHDKINSDIFIASQRAEAEAGEVEEPTLETRLGNDHHAATPAHPAEQRKQYYQQVRTGRRVDMGLWLR